MNTAFGASGEAIVTIELDMRCLDSDPENARYINFFELESFSEEERTETLQEAKVLIDALVGFEFKPGGRVEPEFAVEFFPKSGAELEQTQDVLFLRARAKLQVPSEAESYRIHANDHGEMTVYFLNELEGVPVKRYQALFPGETSYWLNLKTGATTSDESNPSNQSGGADSTSSPAATSPTPARSGWIFIFVAILLAAATATFLIRRESARS